MRAIATSRSSEGRASLPQVADRLAGVRRAYAAAGADVGDVVVLETAALDIAEGRRAGARLAGLPASDPANGRVLRQRPARARPVAGGGAARVAGARRPGDRRLRRHRVRRGRRRAAHLRVAAATADRAHRCGDADRGGAGARTARHEHRQVVLHPGAGRAGVESAADRWTGWPDEDRAVRDVPGRRAVPAGRQGDGGAAGAAGARGGVPGGADVLRADARQHRLPARGAAAGAPPRRGVRAVRRGRRAVRVVRGIGAPPARDGRPPRGRRSARRAGRGGGGADLRAVRAAGRRARREGRRRVLPAPGHLPPDLPLAADAAGGRQAAAAAAPGARA